MAKYGKVNKLIKQSKKDQYQTFIENNKNNPGSKYMYNRVPTEFQKHFSMIFP